jgi:hypothetical protein
VILLQITICYLARAIHLSSLEHILPVVLQAVDKEIL